MKLKRNARWTVSYIDLLMTILGFFVLIYAKDHDPKEVAASLRSAFNHDVIKPDNGGAGGKTDKSGKPVLSDNQSKNDATKANDAKADKAKENEDCLTKAGVACPSQEFLADDLFQPQEAILTDKGKNMLTRFVKKPARSAAYFLIESHGIGNGNARFDRWELAAARTAAVARVIKSSGIDDTHLKIMMAPDSPLSDNGQHLLVTISKNPS